MVSLTKRLVNGAIRLSLGVILLEAALLTGCSSQGMFDKIPQSLGGLPADAPPRPAAPGEYPAVHDMPLPRPTTTLSEDEQEALQTQLRTLGERVKSQSTDPAAPGAANDAKTAAPPPNKPDAAAGQSAGAKPNP